MDVNKINEKDMALVEKLFPFASAEKVPFTFMYGDRRINGIPEEFAPKVEAAQEGDVKKVTITGKDSSGLEIKAEYAEYKDFPVTEWMVTITNCGEKDTPVLSDIKTVQGVLEGSEAVLMHGNGDTCNTEGYEYFYDKVDKELLLYPEGGNPCKEALPYMRLMFKEYSVNIAIGWSAQWEAKFTPSENGNGVEFYAKQQRTNMYLKPGESIRTPRITFMGYTGDESRGRNIWRRWYFKHIIPKENGKVLPPKMVLHTWGVFGGEEWCNATEENQIMALNAYLEKGLRPDIWWIDAGWYPCGGHWGDTGNWRLNEENWPNTMMPVAKKCHENGIQFLLWFEPERIRMNTDFKNNLGDWVLDAKDRDGNNLLDLGNKECCDWLIDHIDNIIKTNGVDIYRQDFNFAPLYTWIRYEEKDRLGFKENQHVQGYWRYWDTLMERNPGLLMDSCASGGRRNDLETMRRSVPFHYTDVGYGNHPVKQKQHREMFEWIPYFRAHTLSWDVGEQYIDWNNAPVDRFAFHCAMAPAITSMVQYNDTDEAFEAGRAMEPVWRRAAELMLSGDYYPLTECRKSAEDYYAMQFDDPEKKQGFFQVLRNVACKDESFTVMPFADESETYEFENMETGEKFTLSGKDFAKGYTVSIPKRSGQIWFYKRG